MLLGTTEVIGYQLYKCGKRGIALWMTEVKHAVATVVFPELEATQQNVGCDNLRLCTNNKTKRVKRMSVDSYCNHCYIWGRGAVDKGHL